MTCNACGEKPKKCGNCNKDFPRAVIEINNPESLILLRKVSIPASMGTEEQVPAAIGKYHNVILKYEANGHIYLYSSDGIPTLLEINIPDEIWERIEYLEEGLADLEEKVGEAKKLTTDDYNWNSVAGSATEPFDCVALWLLDDGMYSVTGDIDAKISVNSDAKKVNYVVSTQDDLVPKTKYIYELETQYQSTMKDYGPHINRHSVNISNGVLENTATFASEKMVKENIKDHVLRDSGAPSTSPYPLEYGVLYEDTTTGDIYTFKSSNSGEWVELLDANKGAIKELTSADYNWPNVIPPLQDGIALWKLNPGIYYHADTVKIYVSQNDTDQDNSTYIVNKADSTELSAIKVLPDGTTYLISIAADGSTSTSKEIITESNVVQNTGESTTDVMSQKAVRDLIFHATSLHPDSKENIQIGDGAKAVNSSVAIGYQANYGRTNDQVVAIGYKAYGPTSGGKSIAIGYEANCLDSHSICIGCDSYTIHKGCIMLGSYSNGTVADGTMYIGTSNTTYGYNTSNYRLLSGLYDPQTNHDAATKGYVDNQLATKIITSASAPSTSTVGEVGTLCAYVTSNTGHLAICTEVVSGNPNTYTWQTLI